MAHILLLEEYPALRRVLALTLRRVGYQVTAVHSVDAMQHLLSQQHFDLLLCDLDMSYNQSIRFAAILRASPPSLPFLAFFAPEGYNVENLQAFGIRCPLFKPIGRKTLLSAIHNALQ